MRFVRNSVDTQPIVDTVFSIVRMAKEDIAKNGAENVVDATIGSLYGEDGKSDLCGGSGTAGGVCPYGNPGAGGVP